MLGTVLVVILLLALVGALPGWSHSRNWGYSGAGPCCCRCTSAHWANLVSHDWRVNS